MFLNERMSSRYTNVSMVELYEQAIELQEFSHGLFEAVAVHEYTTLYEAVEAGKSAAEGAEEAGENNGIIQKVINALKQFYRKIVDFFQGLLGKAKTRIATITKAKGPKNIVVIMQNYVQLANESDKLINSVSGYLGDGDGFLGLIASKFRTTEIDLAKVNELEKKFAGLQIGEEIEYADSELNGIKAEMEKGLAAASKIEASVKVIDEKGLAKLAATATKKEAKRSGINKILSMVRSVGNTAMGIGQKYLSLMNKVKAHADKNSPEAEADDEATKK